MEKKKAFIYKFWCSDEIDIGSTQSGTSNGVEVIIEASNEEKAQKIAREMVKRDFYSLQNVIK